MQLLCQELELQIKIFYLLLDQVVIIGEHQIEVIGEMKLQVQDFQVTDLERREHQIEVIGKKRIQLNKQQI